MSQNVRKSSQEDYAIVNQTKCTWHIHWWQL